MIYVCGDSFCVSDPEYGPCWVDILAQRFPLTNLAQVAATNLLINQQVCRAIAAKASFVIVTATSVTRSEKRVGSTIVPFSYHTANRITTPFTDSQLKILRDYFTEFFDLKLTIQQNQITIEHTLNLLVQNGIPFRFDQGGFEHSSFGNTSKGYFKNFDLYRSHINLWDYPITRPYRPYYHITDSSVHQQVADYYTKIIKQLL